MTSHVKKRIQESVIKGEQALKDAKEVIDIAKKAGIDLSAQETEYITLETQLAELKAAVEE